MTRRPRPPAVARPTKAARQARIVAILSREQVHSQEQLAGLLSQYAGMHVARRPRSPATWTSSAWSGSARADGTLVYALPGRSRRSRLAPRYRPAFDYPERIAARSRPAPTPPAPSAAAAPVPRPPDGNIRRHSGTDGRKAGRPADCPVLRRPRHARPAARKPAAGASGDPSAPSRGESPARRRVVPPGQVPQGAADLGRGERQPGRAAHPGGRGPVPRLGHRPRRLARDPRHGRGRRHRPGHRQGPGRRRGPGRRTSAAWPSAAANVTRRCRAPDRAGRRRPPPRPAGPQRCGPPAASGPPSVGARLRSPTRPFGCAAPAA